MRCPNCGQELREEDKFCANCGAPVPLKTSPDPYGDPYGDATAQPQPSVPINAQLPVQQAAPAPRSFVTQAVITLVLYWILWIPGLIANIIFWQDANRVERETGRAPEGKGCLVALLIVFGIVPFLVVCAWISVTVAAT